MYFTLIELQRPLWRRQEHVWVHWKFIFVTHFVTKRSLRHSWTLQPHSQSKTYVHAEYIFHPSIEVSLKTFKYILRTHLASFVYEIFQYASASHKYFVNLRVLETFVSKKVLGNITKLRKGLWHQHAESGKVLFRTKAKVRGSPTQKYLVTLKNLLHAQGVGARFLFGESQF